MSRITGRDAGAARSAMVGAILGVDAVGHCLALATICFSGALAAGLGLAATTLFLATAVSSLVLWQFGGFRVGLAISQDTTIAILAPAVAFAALGAGGGTQGQIATALAVIGGSALLSGFVFVLVGALGLGRLVRMFPYPVAAGFLASSGLLLVWAALRMLTESESLPDIVLSLNSPDVMARVFPAVAMAVLLIAALRLWQGSTPVLIILILALVGYYVVVNSLGIDRAQAIARGFIPDTGTELGVDFGIDLFAAIDWSRVILVVPPVSAVVLLNLIGILLNTSGVELATQEDIDVNRELQVSGLANLVIGLTGGLTSYLQGGATIMAAKLGVRPTPFVLAHVAVLALACVFATRIVALVPGFVSAGLLMFIGFSMLDDWLISLRHRLRVNDWLIVVGIVVLTMVAGILPAIAIGLLLAVLSFAVGFARLPVIRVSTDGRARRSVRDRSEEDDEILARLGGRIRVMHLQGAMFFGSVEQLTEDIRTFSQSDQTTDALILDLSEVHMFDSSACAALGKLIHVAGQQAISLHLADAAPDLRQALRRWGVPVTDRPSEGAPGFTMWSHLDDALAYCEDVLLDQARPVDADRDLKTVLAALAGNHPRLPDLMARMDLVQLAAGETLMHSDERSDDLYFVDAGALSVMTSGRDGDPVKVRSMGKGAIVGEIATLRHAPRSADVVAETDSRVYRLTAATIAQIETSDRDLAAILYAILARGLAGKVVQTNALLSRGGVRRL